MTIFKEFLKNSFNDVFEIDEFYIKLRDRDEMDESIFYRLKYNLDVKIIREYCQLTIEEVDKLTRDAFSNDPNVSFFNKILNKTKYHKEKMGRVYLSSYIDKCNNDPYCKNDMDTVEQQIDAQIRDKQEQIDQLKQMLGPAGLAAAYPPKAPAAKKMTTKAMEKSIAKSKQISSKSTSSKSSSNKQQPPPKGDGAAGGGGGGSCSTGTCGSRLTNNCCNWSMWTLLQIKLIVTSSITRISLPV